MHCMAGRARESWGGTFTSSDRRESTQSKGGGRSGKAAFHTGRRERSSKARERGVGLASELEDRGGSRPPARGLPGGNAPGGKGGRPVGPRAGEGGEYGAGRGIVWHAAGVPDGRLLTELACGDSVPQPYLAHHTISLPGCAAGDKVRRGTGTWAGPAGSHLAAPSRMEP